MPEIPKYYREGTIETKLAEWLRCATQDERMLLAARCNTSLGYLRQLAHAHRENPKVRFALKIVDEANRIRDQNVNFGGARYRYRLPELTIHDLAEPTKE